MSDLRELLVCVTGASGAIYADRLLRAVSPHVERLGLVLTPQGAEIAAQELGWATNFDTLQVSGPPSEVLDRVTFYRPDDLACRYTSGSSPPDAMIVVPCSAGTAGRIASGLGATLVTRAAAVCLKERKPLVLVVRESPLSMIDLRNLSALSEAGAVIMPASPSFYTAPQTLEEMADFFAARVLDQVGLRLEHPGRWSG
jgi:4-hydroxy-3-polyprenylbenzoate decarboxylase